ncbi:response regulator [Sporosarcina sp. Te-1]|uniref:response regulator n=1 Tax=Sporosarcina sp. Te-1 TaxID=2818390 RepID=UPI001A9FCA5E|nr:response regulator [Sporosarcina sp. Te-1]QTD40046.1 response regulator [Sporosarcina sp. Te-1]
MRYFIIDDDRASCAMLKQIIIEGGLGMVIGEESGGPSTIQTVMTLRPDIVLIDLLMPDMDGLETIERLQELGYTGQFIMISQVDNKEMVGQAYQLGIEFFIHKPINRVEVQSVLKKTAEQAKLKHSLLTIQQSLSHLGANQGSDKPISLRGTVLSILKDMGIAGEAGSEDLISLVELITSSKESSASLPPLKDLYEQAARQKGYEGEGLHKESKAMEQRIRRAVLAAMEHIASLAALDYTLPEFEYYGPRYFDLQDIRLLVTAMEENDPLPKIKVNSKKFIQVLYIEAMEKQSGASRFEKI